MADTALEQHPLNTPLEHVVPAGSLFSEAISMKNVDSTKKELEDRSPLRRVLRSYVREVLEPQQRKSSVMNNKLKGAA